MKFIKFLALILLVVANSAISGQENPIIEKGDKAFNDFDFNEALYFYDVAHDNQPTDASITRKIANTYRRMGRLNISAEWYRKTLELDASNAQDMLLYAESLKSLEQYDEALHWYEMYNKLSPSDSRALSHLKDPFYYKDLRADTAKYKTKSLKINNEFPIIGITQFEDEKFLVSAVNLNQQGGKTMSESSYYLDIYLCELNAEKELINPVRLDKNVNSKYHDGPAMYNFADQQLYITRTNMRGSRPVLDKNGNANLKIYSARYSDNKWSSAQELKFNDDGYSNGYACLTKDGQTLYFVSNKPGGFGGTDIYMSTRSGNNWTDPVNLGDQINTAGNERFPFADDNGILYFASDGHAGLGGLDIFKSEKSSGTWQSPQNMGAPINTNHDDFNLIYDKESNLGFFCSNRNGNGNDDLFLYQNITVSKMVIAGTLKSNLPDISFAGERVQITKLNTNEKSIVKLDAFERFEFLAEPGDEIEMTMMNDEYFNTQESILKYSVKSEITDPYVNVGLNELKLKKIPSHKGELSQTINKGLIETFDPIVKTNEKSDNSQTSVADPVSQATDVQPEIAEATKTVEKAGSSGTNSAPKEADYQLKIKEADKLFKSSKWVEAREAYISATAIKPADTYARNQIKKADEKLNAIKKQNEYYNQLILEGDEALSTGKPDVAKQSYESALKIRPGDDYAKKQLARAGDELVKASVKETNFDILEATIDLKALEIDNVTFDYNKALLRKEDLPTLDKVFQIMKENPNTKLLIRAHCDSRGSLAYNQSLSMSRAMAVQGYLVQRGIQLNRLKTEWLGELRPLNGCVDEVPCEEDQHEINRRAEFKLVKL